MKIAFLFLVVMSLLSCAFALRKYPYFNQCDSRWGSTMMGVVGPGERNTICKEGCAMSCLAMILRAINVDIPQSDTVLEYANPGTLNQWLIANHGYLCAANDCNNLVLNATDSALTNRLILISEAEPKPAMHDLISGLDSEDIAYIAHVRNNTHFVLITGVSETNILVNDPYYQDTTSYDYSTVSDVITYVIVDRNGQTASPIAKKLLNMQQSLQKWLSENGITPKRKIASVSKSVDIFVPTYPLFKQCNDSWGSDIIINKTICEVGCLLTSISMAMNGWGIPIGVDDSNPHFLNKFLLNNGGYDEDNDLDEAVVTLVNPARLVWPADGMHIHNDLSFSTIADYLTVNRVVIANVLKGHHFVLVTGLNMTDSDTVFVNDPGFPTLSYSYSNDIVGWRLFDMN